MSHERKKPGVAFWATVVVGMLIGYPLSLGPACWLYHKAGGPDWFYYLIQIIWDPLYWVIAHTPDPVAQWLQASLRSYADWWGDLANS
jgi:hypothetical protein